MQKLFIYIVIVLIFDRCAQITPLTGGKKDTEPPKVIKCIPENISLNFNAKEIDIQFDEYIMLKDITNQFIITPQTKELPDIQANGKKIKISFYEPLLPNTTYKLAFGNAITDLRESNALQNFEYIFSTGHTIDSLKLNGQILNAFDKKPAQQILVGLYPSSSNDSVIYKDKPLYISKTNDKGEFKFNHLPDKPFKIIAIKDQNKNLLYDGSEEQVAYYDSLINPTNSVYITLLLFKELPEKSFIKKALSVEYGKALVIYNKAQSNIKDVLANGLTSYSQNQFKDTLTLYYANKYDTLETYIHYEEKKTDTLYIKIPMSTTIDKLKSNKAIKYSLQNNLNGSLPFYSLPIFNLNVPVERRNISENKIIFKEEKDSTTIPKHFTILTGEEPITSFTVQSEFKSETNYVLIINSSAFADNTGRTNDSMFYKFKTTSIDDYAQLNLKLTFPKKENYIVQLLNDKEQLIKESIIKFSLASTSEKKIEYKNLLPGIYSLKVVEDANGNGGFDTGHYFLHKQPENIFINSTPIKLLAGWEIENEWIIK